MFSDLRRVFQCCQQRDRANLNPNDAFYSFKGVVNGFPIRVINIGAWFWGRYTFDLWQQGVNSFPLRGAETPCT